MDGGTKGSGGVKGDERPMTALTLADTFRFSDFESLDEFACSLGRGRNDIGYDARCVNRDEGTGEETGIFMRTFKPREERCGFFTHGRRRVG